ncbi:MAG: hypothetical protein ACRDI2_04455 [Chloroflexota bacterium]
MAVTATDEIATVDVAAVPVRFLTREEAYRLFDDQVWRELGMSGEEFLRRWRAGEFAADIDRPELRRVIMLLPFARQPQ